MSDGARLKIGLISPRGPIYKHRTGIWKKSLRYAPLTLTTLASLVPDDLNADVQIFDEGIHDTPLDLDVDLIGISAITGSSVRAYELADHFRKQNVPVVLGGVHPTLVPEEAARHADSVVVGYAEETWPELLRDFAGGRLKARYTQQPGLSLAGMPFPKRDLLPARQYTTRNTFEATRGCIHHCEFCVVPAAWGRPLRKPVADVIEDVKQTAARKLIFLDLNLIADVEYAKELFRALIPLKVRWFGLVTTLVALDGELLELLAASGCRGVLIGFESLSSESLAETGKRFNMARDYRVVIRELHKRGVAIMGCFVFGFDNDTEDTFAQTVEFVNETGIDLPRYAILTPFPGTALFRRLREEGRLITEDWQWYDGQHVVYRPANMSPERLLEGTEWAWRKTYSFRSIATRLARARIQLPLSLSCNLGYRFYARNLSRFYTCREAFV